MPTRAHPSSVAITSTGNMISLGTVLLQEIDQFNNLLNTIEATLKELKKAIRGETVMSSVMELMHTSLVL